MNILRWSVIALVFFAGQCSLGEESPVDGRWAIQRDRTEPGCFSTEELALMKKSPRTLFVQHGLPDSELVRILRENPTRGVMSEDGHGGFAGYYLVDLNYKKKSIKWNKDEAPKLLIPPPLGDFTSSGAEAGYLYPSRGRFGEEKEAFYALYGKDKTKDVCNVKIICNLEQPRSLRTLHMMLSSHLDGNPLTTGKGENKIIESFCAYSQGWAASWLAEDKIVYLYSGNRPDAVVKAYLERYPSSLPESYVSNVDSWGAEELSYGLEKMKNNIEGLNDRLAYESKDDYNGGLRMASCFLIVKPIMNSYRLKEGQAYKTNILDGLKSDYESYKKELFQLRREILTEVEKIDERIKKEGSYYDKARKTFVLGKKPAELKPEATSKKTISWVLGGGVAGLGTLVFVFLFWRRKISKATHRVNIYGDAIVGNDFNHD